MITDKVDLSTNQRCDCGLSQIIRLNVITFSALLNDGMTTDRKSTRLNSSHASKSRMPSSA